MRSYIFTQRERRTIRGFLGNTVARDDPLLMVILTRVKGFTDLRGDVELYAALRKAVAADRAEPALHG